MMRVKEGRDRAVEVTRATRLTRFQSTSAIACCKVRCVMETALRPKDSRDGPQATDIFLPFPHVPYSLHPLFSLQKVNLEPKANQTSPMLEFREASPRYTWRSAMYRYWNMQETMITGATDETQHAFAAQLKHPESSIKKA